MQAAMQLVPFKDRAAKIEQFNADLKAGKLDISELYRKAARCREHANLTNSIPQGLGMGGIAGVLLIVVAGSPAGLALLAAGGIAGGRTLFGFWRWQDFQEAVRENDFIEYLTDQELSELEDLLTNSGKPATPVLAESYAQLIDSMDEIVELDDSPLLKLAKQFRGEEIHTAPAGDAVVDVEVETLPAAGDASPTDEEGAMQTTADLPDVPEEVADDIPNVSEEGIGILFENGAISPAFLLRPLKQRAEIIMQLLAESGCDISNFINRPTFGAGGEQRSGKSTLLLLMAILEKALYGRKIFYITNDDDVYPITFDGIVSGIPGKKTSFNTARAVQGFELFSETINKASMGELKGETWILDEFSKIASGMPENLKSDIWELVLTGLSKRGGRAKAIFHGRTSTMCGVPGGWKGSFAAELAIAWTDREETGDPDCPVIPSGTYTIYRQAKAASKNTEMEATSEVLVIPDWLLFDRNPKWGDAPCPVRSLLRFFPEFDTRLSNFIPIDLLKETKQEARKPPIHVKPPIMKVEPLAEDRPEDYWDTLDTQPFRSAPQPEDDPFKIESYQAVETQKAKKKVSPQDKIDGLDKTYEDAMAQISKWLRAKPGTEFTTSALIKKFNSNERVAVRKVIRAIVKRMGQSPQGCYLAIKDPEKGWIISYQDPEEEEDFVTIEL